MATSLSEIRLQEKKRYIVCLEEEMRKIEAFRRVLPLSMQLLSSGNDLTHPAPTLIKPYLEDALWRVPMNSF